jgi:hypothetical protein
MSFRLSTTLQITCLLIATILNGVEIAWANCFCTAAPCSTTCTGTQFCCKGCGEYSSECKCCESGQTCVTTDIDGFGYAVCNDPSE